MKLFVAAICLLCCGCAFGQDKPFIVTFPPFDSMKPIFLHAENRIWALANCCGATVWTREEWEGAHKTCVESKIRMDENCDKLFPLQAPPPSEAKQKLICDWAKDKWFCPTREPISNLDGKLVPSGGSGTVEGDGLPHSGMTIATLISPPPFDVPAKEWDTQEPTYGISIAPPEPDKRIVHHVACEEKTRFLLKSEDGKSHCLKLVP